MPATKSWMKNTPVTTASMPMSGCDFSSSAITPKTPNARIMPGKRLARWPSAISHAATTAKQGLRNSLGCTENPGNAIQRRAPLISTPITIVSAVSISAMAQPANATRRTPLGDSRLTATTMRPAMARKKTCLKMNMSRAGMDALGHRRARRQHQDVAEADQRRDGHQRPAIDGPPPAAQQRCIGARQYGHHAGFPFRDVVDQRAKPVAALIETGELVPTRTGRRQQHDVRGTVARQLPGFGDRRFQRAHIAMRHALCVPASPPAPARRARSAGRRRCAGRIAAAVRCRLPWRCRRQSRSPGRSRSARAPRNRHWSPCCH